MIVLRWVGSFSLVCWAAMDTADWVAWGQQTFTAHSSGSWKPEVRVQVVGFWPQPRPGYRLPSAHCVLCEPLS